MPVLTSIVARNADGAIGAANRLPWKVRADLRFFRDTTLDQVVIMGRRTHRSLGGCLSRRSNIVVTHDLGTFEADSDCQAVGGVEEALLRAFDLASETKRVFVIGGATIYRQFAPYVDRYLVTEVSKTVPDADAFFDERDFIEDGAWDAKLIQAGGADDAGNEASYRIMEYVARSSERVAAKRAQVILRERSKKGHQVLGQKHLPLAQAVA